MNPSTSINRAEIKRQNAAHSTDPFLDDGKRRVALNALRHDLTGQTVVLPSEDLDVYQKHCARDGGGIPPPEFRYTGTARGG